MFFITFSQSRETDAEWALDYRNDVLEEVAKIGIVVHLSVDTVSAEVCCSFSF